MFVLTPESVHRFLILDLRRCRVQNDRHGLLLGLVRCGGEASFPSSRAPCAKIGLSRTARRGGIPSWACGHLRRSWTPRPSTTTCSARWTSHDRATGGRSSPECRPLPCVQQIGRIRPCALCSPAAAVCAVLVDG